VTLPETSLPLLPNPVMVYDSEPDQCKWRAVATQS